MTDYEKKLVAKLLDMASDRFSNDCCNDFFTENTPEARQLWKDMCLENNPNTVDAEDPPLYKDDMCFTDWWLMSYFAKKLLKECGE